MATLPHPKKSKRTQFTPRLSSRASGCGAKHSGAKSRDLPNHHRRRRFQTNKSRPYPKYAKRTQSQPNRSFPRWPKVSPDLSGNPIPAKSELPTLAEGQSKFIPARRGLVGEPNSSPFQVHHAGQRAGKVYPGAPGMHIGKPNSPPQPLNPRQKSETNPIYPTIYKPPSTSHHWQSTIHNIQSPGPIPKCPSKG